MKSAYPNAPSPSIDTWPSPIATKLGSAAIAQADGILADTGLLLDHLSKALA
jgi:hypothetical protein